MNIEQEIILDFAVAGIVSGFTSNILLKRPLLENISTNIFVGLIAGFAVEEFYKGYLKNRVSSYLPS